MRIFGISDIHIDFSDNEKLIKTISHSDYTKDVLLIAGDVCDQEDKLENIFEFLVKAFSYVFFIPGNHELYERGKEGNALKKFDRVLDVASHAGVHVRPKLITSEKGVKRWIIPLSGWYRSDFEESEVKVGVDDESVIAKSWTDSFLVHWKSSSLGGKHPSRYFSDRNNKEILSRSEEFKSAPVITFSHFLTRRDCLPPTQYLFVKFLPRVCGDSLLDKQLRSLNSTIHLFGHTHIPHDKVHDGIRYVQYPLGYPRERDSFLGRFFKGKGLKEGKEGKELELFPGFLLEEI